MLPGSDDKGGVLKAQEMLVWGDVKMFREIGLALNVWIAREAGEKHMAGEEAER